MRSIIIPHVTATILYVFYSTILAREELRNTQIKKKISEERFHRLKLSAELQERRYADSIANSCFEVELDFNLPNI